MVAVGIVVRGSGANGSTARGDDPFGHLRMVIAAS